MDCQIKSNVKSFINKKGETFGFSPDDYESFVRAYSELSYAMSRNDYDFVSLFQIVREQLGKQNFSKLLINGLGFNQSEISELNRKLSAYQMIPSQTVWNTIGYRGIQKIMSMPKPSRERLLRDIEEKGENLTIKDFNSLYGRWNSRSNDRSQLSRKSERKNDRKGKNDRKSYDSNDRITMTRGELERIVRSSIERILSGPSQQKSQRKGSKKQRSSKLSQFVLSN